MQACWGRGKIHINIVREVIKSSYTTRGGDSPVQARFILQDVWVDQLFKQTVDQDGQRGEADVVQCQINTVVQRLSGAARRFQLTSDNPVQLPAKGNCPSSAIIYGIY